MKILDHIEEWIITFLMGAATLIIFASVVHRYASGFAIPGVQDWLLSLHMGWAQELCIIMFVWMAKFGAAYGVRTGIHVGVDVLINRLSDSNRSKFVIFGLFSGALFTGIVGTLGAVFVWENGMHYFVFNAMGIAPADLPEGPTLPDLEWPTWIAYAVITNKKFWDGLPADIRKQLEDAMVEATKFANDVAKKENDASLEAVKKSGKTTIYTPTAAERIEFKKATVKVHSEMESRIGKELIQSIYKETGFDPAKL
jgi:TRAP-type C4-dicarboxylate transport system permease small subunit